jgi:hypothetical protein
VNKKKATVITVKEKSLDRFDKKIMELLNLGYYRVGGFIVDSLAISDRNYWGDRPLIRDTYYIQQMEKWS